MLKWMNRFRSKNIFKWIKVNKLNNSIAITLGRIKILIKKTYKAILRFISVIIIIAGAWFAFLTLIFKDPPIPPTPILIMIWTSVFLLLCTIFPSIFNRIKKIKFKDLIEVELETASKTLRDQYMSFGEDEHIFTPKGNIYELQDILNQAIRRPFKPILLVVNLKNGENVSIPMLYIYLALLDIIGSSVTVLFISTPKRSQRISDISKDSLIGVVSEKTLLKALQRQYPYLLRIYYKIYQSEYPSDYLIEDLIRRGFNGEWSINYLNNLYSYLREYINEHEFLTEHDIFILLNDKLDNQIIDLSLGENNLRLIRDVLNRGNEYILSIKNRRLYSVVLLSYFTKSLSNKVLEEILNQND